MNGRKSYPSYKESSIPWLASIPIDWEVQPFFSVASEKKLKNNGMKETNLLSLSYGQIIKRDINSNEGLLPESFETYQIVDQNDIVFRMTDLQNDQRSLRSAIVRERGIITSAYIAVQSKCINPIFLNYLMRAYDVQKVFYAMGGGLRQSLKFEDLRRLPLVIPSVYEQSGIVDFLNRETTRIDRLISKKTRFIELLKEKRQAVITKAVTKGLDDSVEMKDSGVEWIRQMPEHWVVGRLRDFCSTISTGPFGTALGVSDYVENGIPVINPSHMEGGVCIPDSSVTVSVETATRLSFWALREGDLIAARRGELGRAAIVTHKESGWICGTGSLRLTPIPAKASPLYLYSVLQAGYARAWLDRESVGSTMPNLNESLIGRLPVVIPPSLAEQSALLLRLNQLEQRLENLTAKTRRSIELLKEHRAALITAAVTGKIDVREAA